MNGSVEFSSPYHSYVHFLITWQVLASWVFYKQTAHFIQYTCWWLYSCHIIYCLPWNRESMFFQTHISALVPLCHYVFLDWASESLVCGNSLYFIPCHRRTSITQNFHAIMKLLFCSVCCVTTNASASGCGIALHVICVIRIAWVFQIGQPWFTTSLRDSSNKMHGVLP